MSESPESRDVPIGPPDTLWMPRCAGPDTFARTLAMNRSARVGIRGPLHTSDGLAATHAPGTALAAAHVVRELAGLFALQAGRK